MLGPAVDNPRLIRQQDLVPSDRLTDLTATVIGVGVIGRQVALQLASLGVSSMQVIDPDTVDETNIITRGYAASDIGRYKVDATAEAIGIVDPEFRVEVIRDRFRPRHASGDVISCCVDSISARTAIWRSLGPDCDFWSDGRMPGETMRILGVAGNAGRSHYPTSLCRQGGSAAGTLHSPKHNLLGQHCRRTDAPPLHEMAARDTSRRRPAIQPVSVGTVQQHGHCRLRLNP